MAREPRRTIAAGLNSGTSCDAHAGALIRISGSRPRLKLVACGQTSYSTPFRRLLLELASGRPAPAREFARARRLLTLTGARLIRSLCRRARISPGRLAFVGVHGHTFFHDPAQALSWQAADLGLMAEELGITVVGDFRARDVAAGGEGAPLAPEAHRILFTDRKESRLILNLGGIANVTWLPARARPAQVAGFDTGPANMLLDLIAERKTNGRMTFDAGGAMAARGKVIPTVLASLLRHPFFRRPPPKSTGREEFGLALLPRFRRLSIRDALATACAFTALSVKGQLEEWLPRASRKAATYVGGGGARNRTLMRALEEALAPRRLQTASALGFPEQALEPVCFALLAHSRLAGRPNVLPRVTGARRAVSAGTIVPAR